MCYLFQIQIFWKETLNSDFLRNYAVGARLNDLARKYENVNRTCQ